MFNSTIRQKTGICPLCPGSDEVPLIAGKCQRHYWEQNRLKSAAKSQSKKQIGDVGLQYLIDDADAIFSRLIRLMNADENGMVECFTCGAIGHYKYM